MRATRPKVGVKLALLARPAWFARVAQLAENLAQPVVDSFKDGGPLPEVDVVKRGESSDGRVHAVVTGGSGPDSVLIHLCFTSSGGG